MASTANVNTDDFHGTLPKINSKHSSLTKLPPNCAVGAAPESVRPLVHDFGRVQIDPFGAIQFGLIDGQSKRHSRLELLGGMSFSLVKTIKMAQLHTTQSKQCFFHYDDHQSQLPMGITNSPYAAGGSSISDFVAQLPPAPPLLVHIAVPFLLIAATFVGLFNSTVALGLYFQFRPISAPYCAVGAAPEFVRPAPHGHVFWHDFERVQTDPFGAIQFALSDGQSKRHSSASGAPPPSSPASLADFERAHALHDLNQSGKRVRERLRRVAQNGGLRVVVRVNCAPCGFLCTEGDPEIGWQMHITHTKIHCYPFSMLIINAFT
ncbi:hypothetical protein niasHT_034793 [Heterodera trifolii]|uniref:Uncharacterized protein n=1 Tax=Heterodera trifolii TaxID=157864 RepID=A0ABD2J4C4_9BILA